jgi:hypothetical protein
MVIGDSDACHPFALTMLRKHAMPQDSAPQAMTAAFSPRHFYYSRYLCVTNAFMCGSVTIGAIASNPAASILALPFAAWTYVCLRELIQRKPAITVSAERIIVRKLVLKDANLSFDDLERITKTEIFGQGNNFRFSFKADCRLSDYQVFIYNNVHLNCSVEAHELVAAIRAARPDCNLLER